MNQKLGKIRQWVIVLIIIAVFVIMLGFQPDPWRVTIVTVCVAVLGFHAGYDTSSRKTITFNYIAYAFLMSTLIAGWTFNSWPVLRGQPPMNSPLFYLVWVAFFAEWLVIFLASRAVARRTVNN